MESQNAISKLASAEARQEYPRAKLGTVIDAIADAALGEDARGKDWEARAQQFLQQLSTALKAGESAIFRDVIEVERRTRPENAPTLLMFAVMANKPGIVRELVAAGVDVNVRIAQFFEFDALYFAIDNENLEITKILIEAGATINGNGSVEARVKQAIKKENLALLKVLLDVGALTFWINPLEIQYSYLPEAVAKGYRAEIIEMLLQAGCNPNARDSRRTPVLTIACQNGYEEVVRILLAAGAEPNLPDWEGLTPVVRLFSLLFIPSFAIASFKVNLEGLEIRLTNIARTLAAAGVNPNVRDLRGRTPLMLAAEAGCFKIAKIWLEGGAEVNATEPQENRTALDFAILNGHTALIRLLETAGARATVGDSQHSEAAFFGAAKQGNLELLQAALKAGISPNASEEVREEGETKQKTALLYAVAGGHLEAVRLLIAAGANVNLKERPGRKWAKSALMYAAQSDRADILRLLLAAGAKLHSRAPGGSTALHFSVRAKAAATTRLLLESGADPYRKSTSETPFESAVYAGLEVAKLLLEADPRRGSPRSIALREEMLRGAAFDGNLPLVRLLLRDKLNVDALAAEDEDDAWTALVSASAAGALEVVEILLAAGADVNFALSPSGNTALSAAAYGGHLEVVRTLLAAGANVNALDEDGWTPLHHAAILAEVETIQTLLEAGANPELRNGEGKTARDLVTERRWGAIPKGAAMRCAQLLENARP